MADWKAGSIGVSTFHCPRCMKNWLKLGDLPQDCNEPEQPTEGPAMCMAYTDTEARGSEMVVGGMVGEDGKPVRIKVEAPQEIKKLLKKERQKKKKRKRREDEGGAKNGSMSNGQDNSGGGDRLSDGGENELVKEQDRDPSDEFVENSSSEDSSDDEETFVDLPDSFKKYILKKAAQHQKAMNTTSGVGGIVQRKGSGVSQSVSGISDLLSLSSLGSISSSFLSDNDFDNFLKGIDSFSSNKSLATSLSKGEGTLKELLESRLSCGATTDYGGFSDLSLSDEEGIEVVNSSLCGEGDENRAAVTGDQLQVRRVLGGQREDSVNHLPDGECGSGVELCPSHSRVHSSNPTSRQSRRKTGSSRKDTLAHSTMSASRRTDKNDQASHRSDEFGSDPISGSGSNVRCGATHKHTQKRSSRVAMKRGSVSDNTHHQGSTLTSDPPSKKDLHLPKIADSSSNLTTAAVKQKHRRNVEKRRASASESAGGINNNQSGDHLPRVDQLAGNLVQQEVEGWSRSIDDDVMKDEEKESRGEHKSGVLNHTHIKERTSNSGAGGVKHKLFPSDRRRSTFANISQPLHPGNSSSTTNGDGHTPARVPTAHGSNRRGSVGKSTSLMGNVNNANSSRRLSVSTNLSQHNQSRLSNATIKQDVELSFNRHHDNRASQIRARKKSKPSQDFLPQMRAPSQYDMTKTLSEHIPEYHETPHIDLSHLQSLNEDHIPRRIGRKLVNKTRRGVGGEGQERSSMKYNSKDISDYIENSGMGQDGGSGKNKSSRQTTHVVPSGILKESKSSSSQSPRSSAAVNQSTGSTYNNTSMIPMPLIGRGGDTLDHKERVMSAGLGPRGGLPSENTQQQYTAASSKMATALLEDGKLKPSTPVQLKPLPDNYLTLDIEHKKKALGEEEEPGSQLVSQNGDGSSLAAGEDASRGEDGEESGLEVILEEDEEEEDDDDFDIKPITELKPISDLSFTSAYAYSFYRMGGPYKAAYNKVHRRAVGPMPSGGGRRSRTNPAKTRKRKR